MVNKYRRFLIGAVFAAIVTSVMAPSGHAFSSQDLPSKSVYASDLHMLVAEGVIQGLENRKFSAEELITRGEVAKIIARLLNDPLPNNLEAFTDISVGDADQELVKAVALLKAKGILTGSSNGNFKPYSNLTNQHMAKVLVEAFSLQHTNNDQNELTDIHTASPAFQDYIAILAENGVVQVGEKKFRPLERVSYGEFASFLQRARQAANQTALPQEDEQEKLLIESVQLLGGNSRYLEVNFTSLVSQLTHFQFKVLKNDSKDIMGAEEVRLNKNKKSAVVTLYKGNTLKTGEPYTLLFEHNGKREEFNFEHYKYHEGGFVTNANAKSREIELSELGTLKVPGEMVIDFQRLAGQRVRVWFDSNNYLKRFVVENDSVFYDGIEVGSKIKLIAAGKKYKVTTNTKLYVNGKKADLSNYKGKELPYAKVVLNKDEEIALVYAYTWETEPIVVKKIEGNMMYGLGGDALDTAGYIILKDANPISISELKKGDIVYFNKEAKNTNGKKGLAEVYNHTVTGKVTQVFDGESFEVKDKVYNSIGDIFSARVLSGKKWEDFRGKEAKRLKGKEVMLYFSRNEDLVFVEKKKN